MSSFALKRLAALSLLGAAVPSCQSAPPFGVSFENTPSERVAIGRRLETRAVAATQQQPLALIVVTADKELVRVEPSARRIRWRQAATVASRITVGREALLYATANQALVARDLRQGRFLWRTPLGKQHLVGATWADGDFFVLTRTRSKPVTDWLSAYSELDGSLLWRWESSQRLAVPAADRGFVFVPLRSQSLAILDASSGRERLRARFPRHIAWVRAERGQSVAVGGGRYFYRLQDWLARGGTKALEVVLPDQVPGDLQHSGYDGTSAAYSALDQSRLLWRPAGAHDSPRLLDGRIFALHFRFLFAFEFLDDDPTARLRWAHVVRRDDAAGVFLGRRALWLVTRGGEVVSLSLGAGSVESRWKTGLAVHGVSLAAPGRIEHAASEASPATASGARNEPMLRHALLSIIDDRDKRFSAMHDFALSQLGTLEPATVAADLIAVVSGAESEAVAERAAKLLSDRPSTGALQAYLEALDRHYDYSTGATARAVGPVARALAQLKVPEAVEPLLAHLADHETSLDVAREVVRALVAIAEPTVVESFRDYLLTYRCDPDFGYSSGLDLLKSIIDAIVRFGNASDRQLLRRIEQSPHTLQSLRDYLGQVLSRRTDTAVQPGSQQSER